MKGHKWGHLVRISIAVGTLLATVLGAGAHYRLGSH